MLTKTFGLSNSVIGFRFILNPTNHLFLDFSKMETNLGKIIREIKSPKKKGPNSYVVRRKKVHSERIAKDDPILVN